MTTSHSHTPAAGWAAVPQDGWNRVLLKLSGEAFAGDGKLGVDPDVVR
ncbi:MAG: UMP kinase, partial [Actinobacteria bacterium]|nr:UMP kinase [Actinomycetota bacterium]